MDTAPKTLLIVDDEPTNIELIQELVAEATLPVRVLTAGNGHEALARAREAGPDLILLDLKMPGMDGWEVVRRLKADPATARIHIVALTAQSMPGDREAALSAGCDEYMSKPVDLHALLAVLRERLA